jgi:hypothetical protein
MNCYPSHPSPTSAGDWVSVQERAAPHVHPMPLQRLAKQPVDQQSPLLCQPPRHRPATGSAPSGAPGPLSRRAERESSLASRKELGAAARLIPTGCPEQTHADPRDGGRMPPTRASGRPLKTPPAPERELASFDKGRRRLRWRLQERNAAAAAN